jgi:hypothetical protein
MPACSGADRVEVESRHHLARKRADFRTVLLHENGCNPSRENCVEERLATRALRPGASDGRTSTGLNAIGG